MSKLYAELVYCGIGGVPEIRITAIDPTDFEGRAAVDLLRKIVQIGTVKCTQSSSGGEIGKPSESRYSITLSLQ